jgi:cation:H+ antiporter
VETGPLGLVFVAGAVISLGTSWVLVSRIERLGERLGLTEALLGLVAALAADTPEVTSAITALVHHEPAVGAGIVIGSNLFNLAALLGLAALVAGTIALHRRVIALTGAIGIWIAAVCLALVVGSIPPAAGLGLVLLVLVPYAALLGLRSTGRVPVPERWRAWLVAAVAEEERELEVAIRPRAGRAVDAVVGGTALIVVVAASIVMERAASTLGERHSVPGIVTGGIVLAAVTSLPNAVAAVYLAMRRRGTAVFSIALNSNALNVAVGLLLPATVVGLGRPSRDGTLVAAWYVGLTLLALGLAYRDRGLRRGVGLLIVAAYAAFVASLVLVG